MAPITPFPPMNGAAMPRLECNVKLDSTEIQGLKGKIKSIESQVYWNTLIRRVAVVALVSIFIRWPFEASHEITNHFKKVYNCLPTPLETSQFFRNLFPKE